MGGTHVTATVSNPADPQRQWKGEFLVDPGATDCLVPAKRLHAIGLEPVSKRVNELADGREMAFDVGLERIPLASRVRTASQARRTSSWTCSIP
jgi:hypothetical protein